MLRRNFESISTSHAITGVAEEQPMEDILDQRNPPSPQFLIRRLLERK
jgi:hypothetical protein